MVDLTYKSGLTDDCHLGDFLSRPVRIYTQTWTEGSNLSTSFAPWDLYFNSTNIKKKIDNFGLLHCKLRLKIMVNASPFYYGYALASYHPLKAFNAMPVPLSLGDQHVVPFSQRPHIWLFPQDSQGGEMELPFFYHKNWIEITDRNEFLNMGDIHLNSVGPLYNANSVAGSDVEIQVYAWAEDVELAAPTAGLALQSSEQKISRSKGNGKSSKATFKPKGKDVKSISKNQNHVSGSADEYGKGVVSTTASAISAATGALSNVPVIGPYMSATSFVANAAADVASYFGYSNPPVLDNVVPYKSVPFPALSSPEISTPIEKLTLDPKNELCIDSRTVGLDGTDELAISTFVQRESYLDSFTWNPSQVADTLLWGSVVHPQLTRFTTVTSVKEIYAVPMAHLSRMFEHWHGDLIFRFTIIASKYHRGRIRISWDPVTDINGIVDTESINYTETYDIAETQDIEIRVPWMQPQTWGLTDFGNYGDALMTTTGGPVRQARVDNGKLNVRVLNNLTAPDASSLVRVAVSVRAAENFAFANPRHINPLLSYFEVQSDGQLLSNGASKESEREVFDIANADDAIDASYLVMQGEAVKSIRTLLRRGILYKQFKLASDAISYQRHLLAFSGRYPLSYGWDPNGINVASNSVGTPEPFNFTVMTPMNWISPCFVGQRGSVNWRLNVQSPDFIDQLEMVRLPGLTRSSGDHNAQLSIANSLSENQFAGTIYSTPLFKSFSGVALTNQRTQTGLSAQVPMQSTFRMQSTDPAVAVLGQVIDGSNEDSMCTIISTMPVGTAHNANSACMNFYCSAGTDYTCFFFKNIPVVHLYAAIPTATP